MATSQLPRVKHVKRAKGGAPPGERNGMWKGGISRDFIRAHMPHRLIAKYDAIINDPELSSVRHLVAVTNVRLTELLAKIPTKESRAAWEELDATRVELAMFAARLSKQPKLQAAFTAVLDRFAAAIKLAAHEYHIWDEIHGVIERSRRLAKTEAEREQSLQANLTAAQTIALFNRLFQIITEEVTDPQTRARLGQSLVELLQRDTPHLLTAGKETA